MIPLAILGFLVGAVFAWRFRVWILVPTTLLFLMSLTLYRWSEGTPILPAMTGAFLISVMPQMGYAFGLVARIGVLMLRLPHSTGTGVLARRRSASSI